MLSPELVRGALDSAPHAMLILDDERRILFANRQVSALFGYGAGELKHERLKTLLPERFRGLAVESCSMGAGVELFARRKDGSEFPVEINLSPMSIASASLVVADIHDTTECRRIQAELRQQREAAERASLAKSRFLAAASHDLRQPMQALALLNGTMQRMAPNGVFADALEQEAESIAAMSRLINSLLDISKLESGAIKPEITDFPVNTLFEELKRESSSLAAAKGLTLQIEPCNEYVHSDASLVGQVMRNFIANAIKYTQRGWVRLLCMQEQGVVRLMVRDSGVGIAAAELPHIFDDFYQVGVPSNTAHDGYGLGLAIVSRIAQLLHAPLHVNSESGNGTEISIELPRGAARDAAQPQARPLRSAPAPRARGRCVLLVDDDERVRRATRALLKVEGFDVQAAACVSEAITLGNAHPEIRMLVTDYHLAAGETGLQVVEALRKRFGDALPAVMITGDTSSAIKGLGDDHHIRLASKPIDPDELLRVMDELLGGPE